MVIGIGVVIILIGLLVFSIEVRTIEPEEGEGEDVPLPPQPQPEPSKLIVTPLALRRAYFAIRRKEELVNEQLKEMGYQRRELHLQQWGNDLFWRESFLENKQQKLELTEQEMEVNSLHRELDQKKVDVEQFFKERGFALKEEELKNIARSLDNKKEAIQIEELSLIQKRKEIELIGTEIIQEHKKKEIELAGKEIGQVLQEKMLDIRAKEIQLEEQMGLHRIAEAAQQLQNQILDFREQKLTFREKKASVLWGIKVKNDLLSIRLAKIDLLEKRVNQMYAIKSQWLKIEARQNQQDYRQQQQLLKGLFDQTIAKIRELKLTRWENDLIWDQKEVDRKWKIMEFIEEKWTAKIMRKNSYGDTFWETETNPHESLKDLVRSGYIPTSPLLPIIDELKNENQKLKNKLIEAEKNLEADQNKK